MTVHVSICSCVRLCDCADVRLPTCLWVCLSVCLCVNACVFIQDRLSLSASLSLPPTFSHSLFLFLSRTHAALFPHLHISPSLRKTRQFAAPAVITGTVQTREHDAALSNLPNEQ